MCKRDAYTGVVLENELPDEPDALTHDQAAAVDAMIDARLDAFLRSPDLAAALDRLMLHRTTTATIGPRWQA